MRVGTEGERMETRREGEGGRRERGLGGEQKKMRWESGQGERCGCHVAWRRRDGEL